MTGQRPHDMHHLPQLLQEFTSVLVLEEHAFDHGYVVVVQFRVKVS